MFRIALLATSFIAATAGAGWAQPVTGLYVGGAGGANFLQTERVESFKSGGVTTVVNQRLHFDAGVVGLASVGYGFGNGLRLEVEGNYRNNRLSRFATGPGQSVGGRDEKYGGMGNVLFDLDIGSAYLYPYIGAGAGVARTRLQTASNFNGATLRTTGDESSFAYQAIAGLSFPIPPVVGLSLTAEYRYYALAGTRDFTQFSAFNGVAAGSRLLRTSENYNHSLLLGLKYAFNVPAPAAEAPVPVAPQTAVARTYLVFFDWDRADLTDRARAIVNEAAQATTRVAVTRIEVAGHADKSGTAQYNQGLSQRRAAVVRAELVRLGVPAAAITTQGFGDQRPLVQTAAGVREPQNRRVEIVLR